MSANTNPGAPSETREEQGYGPGGRARLNKASPLGLIHRVVEDTEAAHLSFFLYRTPIGHHVVGRPSILPLPAHPDICSPHFFPASSLQSSMQKWMW
jgi:hypothetical protein